MVHLINYTTHIKRKAFFPKNKANNSKLSISPYTFGTKSIALAFMKKVINTLYAIYMF